MINVRSISISSEGFEARIFRISFFRMNIWNTEVKRKVEWNASQEIVGRRDYRDRDDVKNLSEKIEDVEI